MSRTKIEWADYQWNPLTGAPGGYRTGPHTYRRFSGDVRWNMKNIKYRKDGDICILDEKPVGPSGSTLMYPFGSAPTYHRYKERFDALENMQSPRNILVCQESDLFGPWVPDWIIKEVMDFLQNFEDYHFLFLTDYPERLNTLANDGTIVIQENFWYGIHVINGTVERPFKESCGKWFVVIEPGGKRIRFNDHPDWMVIRDEKEAGEAYEGLCNVYENIPLGLPTFDTGTEDVREFPEYLKYSEPEKRKLFSTCMNCGKTHAKNEMYTLSAKKGRTGKAFTYGYLCDTCMKREYPQYE